MSSKLSDAYLRAIFSFLTADDDEDRDIIVRDRRGMKLADRVALACVFVPDARLHDFIGELLWCNDVEENGREGHTVDFRLRERKVHFKPVI